MFDEFRQNVKKLAKEQGLTYAKMAESTSIEESTIKSFMCGASDSRRVAEKLADVLGINILYSDGEFLVKEREVKTVEPKSNTGV